MAGLHHQIKQTAKNGKLVLSELKPNSREVAKRMIRQGELLPSRCGKLYVLAEIMK